MVFMLIGINEEDNIGSGMLKTNTCESGHSKGDKENFNHVFLVVELCGGVCALLARMNGTRW